MTLLKCSEPKSSQKWKQFLKRKKIWFAESIRNVIRYWYCLNCFLIQINLCLKMEYVTFSCQLVIMDGLQSNYSCWIYHDNTTKWNHTVQNGASTEHKDHIGMPSILVRLINGILLPKLLWPTVRKNCSSDREKPLKFKVGGREFANILRSLEQFVLTVKG